MLLLAAAAILPRLFWDAGPDTAAELRSAGIVHIALPAARADAWKGASGITIEIADPKGAVKMTAPSVDYRANQGTATRAPWLNANPWEFLRHPKATFLYTVAGQQAPLAAAEAFSYGADALLQSDAAGLQPLARMLEFLRGIEPADLPPVADIGFVDDGSDDAGEVLNLMVRGNLLVQLVPKGGRGRKLTVELGGKDYPREQAAQNPGALAHLVRANLTDERRGLRIYGSQVVLGRLTAAGNRMRLQLLNYAGADRKVDGLRVRVLGRYPNHRIAAAGSPGEQLLDYTLETDATEFTLPELKTFAVIDLSK
jgi:hypothetical protein